MTAALAVASAPASALGAAPSPTTGGPARVTPTTATLTGSVDTGGMQTSYSFDYGTSTAYGARTAGTLAGARGRVAAAADLAGLTPATRYHFRLVARNAQGVRRGADRTFTTARQPLGFTLTATPNPVPFGATTTLSGALTGTGGGGRQIVLQQRPFPFTAAFTTVGNALVTAPDGTFAFPVPGLGATTQFRVQTTSAPAAASGVVTVGVAVRVATQVSAYRVRPGRLVRLSGTIQPARDGAQFAVQKQRSDGAWVTVAGGITHHAGGGRSSFSRRIRLRHSGRYRIFVAIVDGNLTSATGREVSLRLRR